MEDTHREARKGFILGVVAYLIWGTAPLYFKLLGHVGAVEVVAHRIVWSPPLLLSVIALSGGLAALKGVLTRPRILAALATSSVMIAINWVVYIWAINHAHILAASLGYFLNPLVNILLGVAVLKERLTRLQSTAIALAAAGVALLAFNALDTLWISLTLAFSFGFYGLIRKVTPVTSLEGLTIETGFLTLPSLAWIGWLVSEGRSGFGIDRTTDALLIFGAVVTAVPLLLFASSARRLRFVTLGLLQYIAPTIQFLIAAFVYGEPLGPTRIACFAFIWSGLALYSYDGIRIARAARRPEEAAA